MLRSDQIHVWRVPLNQNRDRLPELRAILSSAERDRADRFHFEKDRNQFIESRAVLRQLLGQYLKLAPEALTFTHSDYGKPSLIDGDLRFNLSRRDGLALVAVTRGREIGVDVELVRPDLDLFEIAEVSFSENEFATLKALPESDRIAGFYNCWTRKEAFVKAVGEGLSFPLKQFDVSLAPGEPARLISIRWEESSREHIGADVRTNRVSGWAQNVTRILGPDPSADAAGTDFVSREPSTDPKLSGHQIVDWTLEDISVPEDYVAALAYSGPSATVTCTEWQLD